jgi:CRP-like cAMP-binding protein
LGINVCEFEFPAYYAFFFQRQSLNLIVDSQEVEDKIRRVFQETLFGPRSIDANADFAADYPVEKRPDLLKESLYFRKFGDTFLEMNMLLRFTHFDAAGVAILETQTAEGSTVAVRITKSPLRGGEYHLQEVLPPLPVPPSPASSPTTANHHVAEHEIDSVPSAPTRPLPGTATLSGIIQIRDHSLRYSGSLNSMCLNSSMGSLSNNPETQFFIPPAFGVTVLGSSHGFDSKGSTSGYVLWIGRRGIMIDPPPHSSSVLEKQQIHPSVIDAVILTHCHADHDAGTFQKLLCEKRITLYTTPTIYESFIRKYSALSGIDAAFLKSLHHFRPVKVGGREMRLRGASFNFFYSLHSIPCIGLEVFFADKSIVFSADHCNDPVRIQQMHVEGVLSAGRRDELLNFPWDHSLILHEAGVPPIHTPLATLEALSDEIKERMYLVHVSEGAVPKGSKLKVAPVGVKNTLEVPVDVPEFSAAISVLSLVGDIHFLADLTLSQARGLLEIGYKKRLAAGEVVVPKGSIPKDFCVLSIGLLEVTYPSESEDSHDQDEDEDADEKVKRVHWSIGDYFGEGVFAPHTATRGQEEVRALTDVELIVFGGQELRYLLADAPAVLRSLPQGRLFSTSSSSMRLEILLTFNYTLNSLTRAQKLQLESFGEVRTVKAGEYVWKTDAAAAYSVLVESGFLSYEGRGGQLMKSLGSLLYRRKGSISSSASGAAAVAASSAAVATAAAAPSLSSPLASPLTATDPSLTVHDDVLAQGEDATQSPCPPSFGKGNFVGSVAHSSSLLVAPDLHRQAHNLVALTDATLVVFPADRMGSFFQANPGVLLCLLDAEFVL